jgi:hypothetical protein
VVGLGHDWDDLEAQFLGFARQVLNGALAVQSFLDINNSLNKYDARIYQLTAYQPV